MVSFGGTGRLIPFLIGPKMEEKVNGSRILLFANPLLLKRLQKSREGQALNLPFLGQKIQWMKRLGLSIMPNIEHGILPQIFLLVMLLFRNNMR